MNFSPSFKSEKSLGRAVMREAVLRESLASFFIRNKQNIFDNADEEQITRYNLALRKLCELETASLLSPHRIPLLRFGDIASFISANFEAVKTRLSYKKICFNYSISQKYCYIAFEPRILQSALVNAVRIISLSDKNIFAKVIFSERNVIISIVSDCPLSKPERKERAKAFKLISRCVKIHRGALIRSKNGIAFSLNQNLETKLSKDSRVLFYREESAEKILENSLSPAYYIFGI